MTYSQQVQEQTQSYNRNLDNYFGSITDNYRTEFANAGRFGQDLQVIGSGLKTLSTKLDERRTELQNKAKVTYYNKVLEGLADGTIKDINTDPLATPEDMADRIRAVTDEIRNGMPLEWGTNFLNVDDFQNRVVQQALIAAKTANSVEEIKQLVTDRGYDVSNNSSIAGSVAAARTEWVSQNFMGFDDDLVVKNIPNLLQNSQKITQGYQQANNMRNSVRIENELTVAAQTGSMTVSEIFAKAALTFTDKGKPRNAAQVNDFVNSIYKNIASQGRFVGDARRNYVEHKPSWGGGKTLGELKEGFVAELDTDTSKAKKEQVGNFLRGREVAAALDAQAVFEEYEDLVSTGNRPNNSWVALRLDEFRKTHGEADISLFNRMFTDEEVTSEQAKQMLDAKYKGKGIIYDDEPLLKYLTIQERNQYGSVIQPATNKQAVTELESRATRLIDSRLSKERNLAGAKPGLYNDKGEWIRNGAVDEYNRLFAEGKAMGLTDDKAYERAIKTVLPDVGMEGRFDTLDQLYTNDTAARRLTEKVTRWVGNNPKKLPDVGELEIPKSMLDQVELYQKGITPPPSFLTNISDRIPGVGPADLAEVFMADGGRKYKLPEAEEAARVIRSVYPSTFRKMSYGGPGPIDQAGIELGSYPLTYRSDEVLHPALQGNFEDNMFISIGLNEGTRTSDGGFTDAYFGHTDPGDGAANRGTVSARAGTPEEADQTWKGILKNTRNQYKNTLVDMGIPVGSNNYQVLMFNILDLRVQAPAAVPDFVAKIPQIIQSGVSAESVGAARADSYINPATGKLETTFRSYQDLLRDQMARSMTIVTGKRG
tara:strand:- start:59 stop:2530 length:2472 start_codon:yes stop_codon:yes gene_type:complete